MLDLALKVIAYAGPIFLGLMGVWVTDKPPFKDRRRVWIGAFSILALCSVGAAGVDSKKSSDAFQRRLDEITGGDGFCYLRGELVDSKTSASGFIFMIRNDGDVPSHNVVIAISPGASPGYKDPGYASYGVSRFAAVPPHGAFVASNTVFKEGKYHIDITATNRTVYENLEVKFINGKAKNTIAVHSEENKELLHVQD